MKDLELIYEKIAEGVKIRSKCQWCEEGGKSTKFFLNLQRKLWSVKPLVRKLEVNGKQIYDQQKKKKKKKKKKKIMKKKHKKIFKTFWTLQTCLA